MNPTTLVFSDRPKDFNTPLAEGLDSAEIHAAVDANPDVKIDLVSSNGIAIASAVLWWKQTPELAGSRLGAIGGFTACDENSAQLLLDGAIDFLRQASCKIAVGPMNGTTWQRYRWVTESTEHQSFFMEPRNAPALPIWWQHAGFTILANYSSSLVSLATQTAIGVAVKARIERSGVTLRTLDLTCFEAELERIYQVSLRSFSHNFLYTPLSEEAFKSAYVKLKNHIHPNLVWLAERDGIACGFVFGIADLEAIQHSKKPAVIVKTLAVDPTANCAGLGSLLIEKIHNAARELGFSEAIHALQHESNTSLKITGRHQGHVIRRYGLFSKSL